MSKLTIREVKSTERQAERSEQVQTYSTPQLVVLGQAHTLVQGSDLYKDYQDTNRNFRD